MRQFVGRIERLRDRTNCAKWNLVLIQVDIADNNATQRSPVQHYSKQHMNCSNAGVVGQHELHGGGVVLVL